MRYFVTVLVLSTLFQHVALAAQKVPADNVGRVLSLRGVATVRQRTALDKKSQQLKRGDYLSAGSMVRTGLNSAVRLLMKDKSILDLGPSTHITLARYDVDAASRKRSVGLHVFVGRLWARVTSVFQGEKNYEVFTANAVAGVRGTELVVDVELSGQSQVTCVEGAVEVLNRLDGASQMLGALDRSQVDPGGLMRQTQITPIEVQQMAASVNSGSRLDPAKQGMRMQEAAQATRGGERPDKTSRGDKNGEKGKDEASEESDNASEKDAQDQDGEGGDRKDRKSGGNDGSQPSSDAADTPGESNPSGRGDGGAAAGPGPGDRAGPGGARPGLPNGPGSASNSFTPDGGALGEALGEALGGDGFLGFGQGNGLPPLDLDPAAGLVRIRGRIRVVQP